MTQSDNPYKEIHMNFPINPLPMLFLPSLGMGELAIIFVIILIVFGPGKLPSVMKSLGDGVRQFKDATSAPNEISDENE